MTQDIYFAAVPPDQIGSELQGKVDNYYAYLTSSSLVDLWRRSYYAYYGLEAQTSRTGFGMFAVGTIHPGGSEGEVARIKVNLYRNLLTHLLVLTTQNRPALECRAINSDSASLAQAYLGDGILDYFFRERKLEVNHREAVETGLIFGESYVRLDWDATSGKQYGVAANGAPIFDGDLTATTYHPFNVTRDTTATTPNNRTWYICRDAVNRYDLAAKYPHLADEILSVSSDVTSARRYVDPTKIIPSAGVGTEDTDLVDKFEFLHEPTPALPNGRYTVFMQGGTVLFDGPLPFKHLPIYRLSAADIIGSPFGWTIGFDMLGIQEAIDKLYTVVLTNQMAAGVQNFWSPPGNEVTKLQLSGGLNLIESAVEPKVLQLLSTPAEIFNFIGQLKSELNTISGVSNINQGDVPSKDMSGTALAFMASQAVTFNSGLQNSSNQLLEGLGTGVIDILKDYANTPRIATIVGSFNRPLMKTYMGKDLINVDRVVVEVTSATSKTTAGKTQIAQDLLQSGLIKTPQEYLNVVNTGQLDSLFEGDMAEILLIRAENEDMRSGAEVSALRIDDHSLHILEHKSLLANPDSRRDPKLVALVLNHITEHEQLQQQQQINEPEFLAAAKEPTLPYPQPAPVQPTPMPPPARPGPVQQQQQAPNTNVQVRKPNMPNLPQGSDVATQNAYEQMKGKVQ